MCENAKFCENLKSTFDKAKNIFSTCPDGTVVLSENQSESIFKFGNELVSDKNIYLSIILKSVNNNYLQPLTDVVACSSILKSIWDLYNLDCRIKWPNGHAIRWRYNAFKKLL